MTITILDIAHHRNGICGAPFTAVLFEETGPEASRKVGILFDEPYHCAVLDVSKLAAGDIAFGSNSWRGDHYETHLRDAQADSPPTETPETVEAGGGIVMEPNAIRSKRCATAIARYGDDLPESNLIDFLADAMHCCDSDGMDFHILLAQACRHYVIELNYDQQDERRIIP